MSPPAPPALEARGVDKRFGGVQANRNVSLAVGAGTIHGVVGENGAGKSTLMGVLYGHHRPDRGQVLVHGRRVRFRGPRDALAAGIGMVHQHFMLVEPLTVLENVLLGAEGGIRLRAGSRRARQRLEQLSRDHGFDVDPDARIADLRVGQRQRVEILKTLCRGAEVLILDEPTAVLTPQEVDDLFQVLRSLRSQGKTVLFVTHKLREIAALTDVVTVMRAGEVVTTLRTAETTPERLAELMVGRAVSLRVEKSPARVGEPVLEVSDLVVENPPGVARVKGVSLTVRRGEIVGVAGVSGNGQSELLEALAGIRAASRGAVRWNGRALTSEERRSPRELRRLGVAHVPEDRQRTGLILPLSAEENGILGWHRDPEYNGTVRLHRSAVAAGFRRLSEAYDVRPRDGTLATSTFSGGNQQKIVLARELERRPDLLLIAEPTRGVDVGAVEFIHRRLLALRNAGTALLLVSTELDEILTLADRIAVMHDGRIVGEVPADAATERVIGRLMAGLADPAA